MVHSSKEWLRKTDQERIRRVCISEEEQKVGLCELEQDRPSLINEILLVPEISTSTQGKNN